MITARFQNFSASVIVVTLCLMLFIPCEVFSKNTQFDEVNAWNQLTKQCSFGPRVPGSKEHSDCLSYLEQQLSRYTRNVSRQNFMGVNPKSGITLNLSNLIAEFWPERSRRIILCAHWDTRPWADQSKNPTDHNKPVMGANDGASGVAILLEIGRCLSITDPGIGVDIVLFDGEDLGREGKLEEYCQGSQWYAKNLSYPLPEAAILLDMVGDADLHIPQEIYSRMSASQLQSEIYSIAAELGETAFDPTPGHPVYDDHIALIREGIPAVDLIDFEYEFWHTTEDVPANCSAESLGVVGRVVWEWLNYRGAKK